MVAPRPAAEHLDRFRVDLTVLSAETFALMFQASGIRLCHFLVCDILSDRGIFRNATQPQPGGTPPPRYTGINTLAEDSSKV
jgi:hypothetical protein